MSCVRLKNYFDGTWTESASPDTLPVTNPATGEVIAQVPLSTTEEVGRAVEAAGWLSKIGARLRHMPAPAACSG